MEKRTLGRWGLYAVLVVANILILVTVLGNQVRSSSSSRATSNPAESLVFLPMVGMASEPITLRDNHTSYIEKEADQLVLHLVGEISNESGENLRHIIIEAQLLNRGNNRLATVEGNLAVGMLPDGASGCFDLATKLPKGFDHYELKILSSEPARRDEKAIDSYITAEHFDRDFGWYAVSGVATREAGNIGGDVQVSATYYDQHKRVIGCETTFAIFSQSNVSVPGLFTFHYMRNNAFQIAQAQTLAVPATRLP